MRLFSRALEVIERIQFLAVWILYVAIIILVNFQVLNRFYLHWPIVWTADLSIVLFIWLAFLSASIAIRKGTHFRMRALVDTLGNGAARRGLELFAALFVIGMTLILVREGFGQFVGGWREILPGLQIRMAWAYASIPVSMATALLFAIERLILDVPAAGQRQNQEPKGG
jgi:TRAP-type C4-dicarboxylate transport system permease small subunit